MRGWLISITSSTDVMPATAPADTISRAHSDRAAEILLRLYDRNPDHPGAMHYLVHANDVPTRERESLQITRKYDAVAPRNQRANGNRQVEVAGLEGTVSVDDCNESELGSLYFCSRSGLRVLPDRGAVAVGVVHDQ
jgi:hypothetical protein